ncbi:MAG: D-xylose dehydrogenase [Alphaproteobacteria bacterium MarineAlpha9_Bin7]|nr:MAG: D-xylose dehydrogenase [Alphaproteobacteria bacterium MarineAlpha9_Bin7]
MAEKRIGIIMNGVTGRMGAKQHLLRSLLAVRDEGGLTLRDGTRLIPDPVLVGRDSKKLSSLAKEHGITRWSTDVEGTLRDKTLPIFFDAVSTNLGAKFVRQAIAAGKHIYCEKPTATNLFDALDIYRRAKAAGIKHGVVQDKLWLPGLLKLKYLLESGFFGRVLSVRGEFGYWVFDGSDEPAQRPSWNYLQSQGGGIILDMLTHWRYVLDNLFGGVKAVSCRGVVHIKERWSEDGERYESDAEDAAYATFELRDGGIAHFNSSWAVRVRRDDLLTIQVDGTEGSAVAGLRRCWFQSRSNTPTPVWNPDLPQTLDYMGGWEESLDNVVYTNAFRAQWELFLRHVTEETPFPWNLREGAKGVQLAELAYESTLERRWVDVSEIEE